MRFGSSNNTSLLVKSVFAAFIIPPLINVLSCLPFAQLSCITTTSHTKKTQVTGCYKSCNKTNNKLIYNPGHILTTSESDKMKMPGKQSDGTHVKCKLNGFFVNIFSNFSSLANIHTPLLHTSMKRT